MAVLVLEVVVGVGHVLGGVNFVVFSLAVLHLEGILGGVLGVLAEVGTHDGAVLVGVVVVETALEGVGNTEEREGSPADGHGSEVRHTGDNFPAEEETSEHGESTSTVVSVIETGEVLTVGVGHVVGEEESENTILLVGVVPLETIVLNSPEIEPWSARVLRNTVEVAHGAHLEKHL